MRNLLYLSTLVGLGACGLSEEKFWEKFETSYCSSWDECHTGDNPCPFLGGPAEYAESECDFDPKLARACLNGEYTCDDSFGIGNEFVLPPPECDEVYLCAADTDVPAPTTPTPESR